MVLLCINVHEAFRVIVWPLRSSGRVLTHLFILMDRSYDGQCRPELVLGSYLASETVGGGRQIKYYVTSRALERKMRWKWNTNIIQKDCERSTLLYPRFFLTFVC